MRWAGFDDVFMLSLEDHSTGLLWPDMTDAEREASSIDSSDLHWVGPAVVAFPDCFTSVGGKGAMQYMPPGQFGPFYFAFLGLTTLALFSLQQPRIIHVLWRRPGPTFLVGILMGLMVVTHFFALQQVETAYMIAVKRISLLFGILYGAFLFHEKGLTLHFIAGGLMLAGVILIAL